MDKRFCLTIDADWIPGSGPGLDAFLTLCDELDIRSTVFTTARFAEEYTDTLKQARDAGHEIASHGLRHPMPRHFDENYRTTTAEERRAWLKEATGQLTRLLGEAPVSFRAPYLWTDRETIRMLPELGYGIDSSIPAGRFDGFVGNVNQREFRRHPLAPSWMDGANGARILQIPPSAFGLPLNLTTIRLFGVRGARALTRAAARRTDVVTFYCHPWEFQDPSELTFPEDHPRRHLKIGPKYIGKLRRYLEPLLKRYEPVTMQEARQWIST